MKELIFDLISYKWMKGQQHEIKVAKFPDFIAMPVGLKY